MKKLFAVGFLVATLACASSAQASLYIDPFSFGPGTGLFIPAGGSSPTSVSGIFDHSSILGGQREVTLTRATGTGSVSEDIALSFSDAISYTSGGSTTGSVHLVWDGTADGGALGVHHGLSEDLTMGGLNPGIAFKAATDSLGHTMTIDLILWSTGTKKSKASWTVSTPSQASPVYLSAPFVSFTPLMGGGADPTSITAIELVATGTADTDAHITGIAASMPEPGSIALLGAGALPLLRVLRRRRTARKNAA